MSDDARPIEILLVEDDAADVVLICEAFECNGLPHRVHTASDGVDALAFLRGQEPHAGARRPDLILLDLNLPRMDGREVLAEIKGDARLRSIPVVVLTTSQAEEDVARSYDLHANAYVAKPVDFARFVDVVNDIDRFFGSVAQLPRRDRP